MLDFAMIALGVGMLLAFLGYSFLCEKMWGSHAVRLCAGRRRIARDPDLSRLRARAPRKIL